MKLIIDSVALTEILEGLANGDYELDDMIDHGNYFTIYLNERQGKSEDDTASKIYDLPKMRVPNCLEDILKNCFGCRKPFLKRKKLTGTWWDGEKVYTSLSDKGAEAYEKLVEAIYGLEAIGAITCDAQDIIEELDQIAESKGC